MTGIEDKWNDVIAAEAADRVAADREGVDNVGLMSWLRRSPEHVAEYLGMTRLSDDVASAAKGIDIPIEVLAADVQGSGKVIEIAHRDLRATGAPPRSNRWPQLAGAAIGLACIVALTVAVGSMWDGLGRKHSERYATGHGEERTVRLADGTYIHLNTDSAVTVMLGQNARLVALERGEAYFEVAKDLRRPFRVRIGAAVLQDFGTSFDVFRSRDGTIVTVAEGRVGVFAAIVGGQDRAALPAKRLADLRGGDQVTLSRAGVVETRTRPDLNEVLAWTRQQIVFDHRPIAEVAAEFNRYNDVPIAIADTRIAAVRISGTFNVHAEKSFVRFLEGLPGVSASERGTEIVVDAGPPRRNERGKAPQH